MVLFFGLAGRLARDLAGAEQRRWLARDACFHALARAVTQKNAQQLGRGQVRQTGMIPEALGNTSDVEWRRRE